MRSIKELLRRLTYLLTRKRRDDELVDEMAFHREMSERAGHGPIGNTLRLREQARDAWGWTWIDRFGQDLRYAARTLRRSPGFTITAIAILAVGIGVSVAAFGFINAAFLKPLPVRDPQSLLRFERRAPNRYASDVPFPEVAFLREHSRTLAAVMAFAPARLTLDDSSEPIKAQFVTANLFSELGVSARAGRLLSTIDDDPANTPAVVLSARFWQRHFAGDASVIGRVLTLNNRPTIVIGVASPNFGGLTLEDPDLWLSLARHASIVGGSQLLTSLAEDSGVTMWGRMRPGLTAAVVESELQSLLATLRVRYPADVWKDEHLVSESGGRPGRGSRRGTGIPQPSNVGMILATTGALVLLILAVSCGNLGSLLLARGVARRREIAIRIAVGAGAPRLIRQLFTESLVLASVGALAGLGLGQAILTSTMSIAGAPSWLPITPDWRVAMFTIAVTVIATILFGLAPALQTARQRRQSTLVRHSLIGAQIAASCVLLIVAGLLVRALGHMTSTDPGFAYQRVIAIVPDLASHGYSAERAGTYLATLRRVIEDIPGIDTIAVASTLPLGGKKTVMTVEVDGRRVDVHVNHVDANFFATMGIPMRRGRVFAPGESRVMVVSESLVRSIWPGSDPLTKTLDDRTIVGVVGSARQTAMQDPDAVEAYFPIDQSVLPGLSMLVKTANRPEDSLRSIGARVSPVDRDVIARVQLLSTAFEHKQDQARLTAMGVTLLGLSALLLACVGIVGLVAFSVAQRTKEIGIRIALGASGAQVIQSVLRQLLTPVSAGLLAGTGAAAALSQLLRRELYGVSHLDPGAYLAAIAIFATTVTLAACWPARRALRVDPLRALRTD